MAGHTEHSIVIDAPLPLVWEITNDVAGWPELFTEYAKAEILERDGDAVTFRLTMHPDEEGRVWSWVSRREADVRRREVRAHRVETGPFEYMKIHWTYREEPGGVRMTWTQDFQMKPGAPADDRQMTERLDRNSPVQLEVIKEKVEAEAARRAAHKVVARESVPANRRRGGDIRVVLGPATVNATSGFMGVAELLPGESIAEHYHPYSEEFLYVTSGTLIVDLDGEPVVLHADEGLLVPVDTRHRLRNPSSEPVRAVFHLGPLAPRPELGHVDTETAEQAAAGPAARVA
jgi:aromatase